MQLWQPWYGLTLLDIHVLLPTFLCSLKSLLCINANRCMAGRLDVRTVRYNHEAFSQSDSPRRYCPVPRHAARRKHVSLLIRLLNLVRLIGRCSCPVPVVTVPASSLSHSLRQVLVDWTFIMSCESRRHCPNPMPSVRPLARHFHVRFQKLALHLCLSCYPYIY